MLQIQGVKGEAVVSYREPLTKREMRHHRLSRWVNNSAVFSIFWISLAMISSKSLKKTPKKDYYCFRGPFVVLFMQR
jgi:hypothetical protein